MFHPTDICSDGDKNEMTNFIIRFCGKYNRSCMYLIRSAEYYGNELNHILTFLKRAILLMITLQYPKSCFALT